MTAVPASRKPDFGVFVSYRRDDSAGHAGRLADTLVRRFGAKSVFLDVESIEPGSDFVDALSHALSCCRVVLVIVGPGWLDASTSGARRLDDPADFVRMEIEQALSNGLRVVPVTVGGATMPGAADVPSSMLPFTRCQAYELGDRSWAASSLALLDAIEQWLSDPGAEATPATPSWAAPLLSELPQPLVAVRAVPMVGRRALVAELVEAISARRHRLIALGGEPGIGKTRLAAEVAGLTHERGAIVLLGRCHEDAVRPYEPFAEAIFPLLHTTPAEELGQLGDRLARFLPGRGGERHSRRSSATSDGDDRLDLFDAVGELFELVTHDRECVVVIDDLQWATVPTLQMLQHLLRWPAPLPLVLIATYRDTEIPANRNFAELFDEPSSSVRHVRLTGLTPADVAALAPALDDASVDSLTARAAGNALFITQVLRQVQGGGALDDASNVIGDVIAGRLRKLDPTTSSVLETAAVLGTTFDLPVLEQVLEREALDEVELAVAAGLVLEGDGTRAEYAFVHALVRDALYGRLSSARRSRSHARVASVLDAAPFGATPATIAHHRIAAGPFADVPEACGAAIVAADEALASLVPEEAVTILERAIQLTESGGDRWLRERVELRVVLAEALYESTDEAGEREVAVAAVEEARRLGDAELFAKAALARSYGIRQGAEDVVAVELLTEALDRLPADLVALRAELLVMLGATRLFSFGDRVGADAAREEGMRLARELGDPVVLAEICPPAIAQTHGLADLDLRRGIVNDFGAAVRAIGRTDPFADVALLQIQIEGGDPGWEDTFDRLRSAPGAPAHRNRLVIARVETLVDLMQGSFDDVERRATWVIERSGTLSNYVLIAMLQIFLLRREQGRLSEIAAIAESMMAEAPGLRAFESAIALASLEIGDRTRARERVRHLTEGGVQIPRDNSWLSGLFLLSECTAGLGDRSTAALLAAELAPYVGQLVVAGEVGVVLGAADRALGQVMAVLGNHTAALQHLEKAVELEERMGARPLAARSRYWLARALLEQNQVGDTRSAETMLDAVVAESALLGMASLERQARTR